MLNIKKGFFVNKWLVFILGVTLFSFVSIASCPSGGCGCSECCSEKTKQCECGCCSSCASQVCCKPYGHIPKGCESVFKKKEKKNLEEEEEEEIQTESDTQQIEDKAEK